MLDKITPLVLTLNEETNIGRCLDRLGWAHEIVVIDSGSTDGTTRLASSHPNVRIVAHPFHDHAEQWNFGLDQVHGEWVLALDADYMVGPDLVAELQTLEAGETWGYRTTFRYAIEGRPLRGSLYPPHVVLFRRRGARFQQDGHTQRLIEAGPIGKLKSVVTHDDRKPLDRWISNQLHYADREAGRILADGSRNLADTLRRALVLTPIIVPSYLLFARGLILDGPAGARYVLERTIAECLISLALLRRRLGRPTTD